MSFLDKVVARLKEPSTHAAIGTMLVAAANFAPYPYSWVMLSVAAALGVTGVALPEKRKEP